MLGLTLLKDPITKLLIKKFNELASGKIKRLIINMPPRHTKKFASYLLPAWMIGRNPKLKIIQATHTADLAIDFGRKTKNLITTSPGTGNFFLQDCKRILRLLVNGKRNRAVNILQPVLAEQSRAVVPIS